MSNPWGALAQATNRNPQSTPGSSLGQAQQSAANAAQEAQQRMNAPGTSASASNTSQMGASPARGGSSTEVQSGGGGGGGESVSTEATGGGQQSSAPVSDSVVDPGQQWKDTTGAAVLDEFRTRTAGVEGNLADTLYGVAGGISDTSASLSDIIAEAQAIQQSGEYPESPVPEGEEMAEEQEPEYEEGSPEHLESLNTELDTVDEELSDFMNDNSSAIDNPTVWEKEEAQDYLSTTVVPLNNIPPDVAEEYFDELFEAVTTGYNDGEKLSQHEALALEAAAKKGDWNLVSRILSSKFQDDDFFDPTGTTTTRDWRGAETGYGVRFNINTGPNGMQGAAGEYAKSRREEIVADYRALGRRKQELLLEIGEAEEASFGLRFGQFMDEYGAGQEELRAKTAELGQYADTWYRGADAEAQAERARQELAMKGRQAREGWMAGGAGMAGLQGVDNSYYANQRQLQGQKASMEMQAKMQ